MEIATLDGIADDTDRRGEVRERAELHRRDPLEEVVVLHRQEREVALDAYGQHLGHVLGTSLPRFLSFTCV